MDDRASSEKKETNSIGSSRQKTGGCLLCIEWLSKKLKLVEDGATPPNWKYIGLVFLALFSSASTLTFLFPFLPEMMLTLGYSETDKGTYVGIVASSVFAGRIIGSVFWGWLADRQGRKLVLLITIALNGLFAGLFGFTENLTMAVIFRLLCGAVNGTVGTAKTILYDISDNTNQALSMSMLSISWGMGMIVGPTLGGFLASPAVKWPHVFSPDGLFGHYPYLLPSLFPFVSCALIFIVIFFKFDETFVMKSSKWAKQELTVSDAEENESNNVGKESHHPLLGDMTAKSENSLSQIFHSMHSVHSEAEAAAFMALASVQPEKPVDVNNHHAYRTQSVPDINNSPAYLELSKISHSVSNINGNYHHGTDLQMISENSNKHGKLEFSGNLPQKELRSTENNTNDNDTIKQDRNNQNESQTIRINVSAQVTAVNGSIDHEHEERTLEKMEYSAIEKLKIVENDSQEVTHEVLIAKPGEDNENICRCVEVLCTCHCFQKTSLYKLLRLTDVWATVLIYTMFSVITIAVEDIFPVFASTHEDFGGLGFTSNEIGLAIGMIAVPLLLLQIKLYPFLVSKMGIRKVFLFSAMVSMICCQCIPMVRLLKYNRVWLWICLLSVQVPFKIATNCCFAGTSLLINNSVPQELAGQANGLAMMTTAMGRTLAPILAGLLFTWTVTYGQDIGPPLDTSFPFFVIGALFFVTVFECLHLNPRLDKQKK